MRLPKYLIIRKKDGTYRFVFGHVELHFELLDDWTDECDKVMGGGFWKIDSEKKQIILHGKSTDYGRPTLDAFNKAVACSATTSFPGFFSAGVITTSALGSNS